MENKQYLAQLKVLYVEDEETTREGIKNFLKRRVGKVLVAGNGKEGLEIFRKEKPDIVIADLLMPEMNGMDMLVAMRSEAPDCKFIITSTVSETNTMMKAIDVGVAKYVLKPIELPVLEETLLKVAGELEHSDSDIDTNLDEKRRIEAEIKKEITLYIKQYAGKGPRDVTVFIHDKYIDVVAYDTLTAFEQHLMKSKTNHSLIEQGRRSFYALAKDDLEGLVSELMHKKAGLEKVEIQPGRCDTIVFRL